MKKAINILAGIGIVAAGLATTSCNKVMDKTDLSKITPDVVFADSNIVKLYLDNIYENNLPSWGGGTGFGALNGIHPELSEEGYDNTTSNKFVQGTVTDADVTDFGTANAPNSNYGRLFTINAFIRDLKASPIAAGTKNVYLAQALFFRAYRYFDLVRIYGGVPLVLTALSTVGDDAKAAALLPRNSTTECMKQIISDLDTAIKYLPGKYTNGATDWGRITSGAAAAFKGRVLLTYASPQFNPDDSRDRWQAAYDANLQAKTILDANGFGLSATYDNMWFTEVNNPEAVMITGYNTSSADQLSKNNTWDNATRPSYLGTGGGSNQPSWEFVKSYDMKDGKPAGSSSYTYSDQLFYKNRDPRFDKTVGFNGCTWSINGISNYRLWTYFYGANNTTTETKASTTGFYIRKAIVTGGSANTATYVGTDWMEIRYTEVLLNLAESAVGINRIGTGDEGYQGLIAVRKRAGIEVGDGYYGLSSTMDRAGLFTAILHERQIEFAFEGKRFWDLRRWKLFETVMNGMKRNQLKITLKTGADIPDAATFNNPAYRDTANLDNAYENYFELTLVPLDKFAFNWQSTYYFFPIPQSAINSDPKIVQNLQWNGSFDPLK